MSGDVEGVVFALQPRCCRERRVRGQSTTRGAPEVYVVYLRPGARPRPTYTHTHTNDAPQLPLFHLGKLLGLVIKR